jgi:hypothetical protein
MMTHLLRVADFGVAIAAACAVATVPIATACPDVFVLVKEYGPWVGMILWFIWRDQQREKRMADRVTVLENEQRNVLHQTLLANTAAIQRNSDLLNEFKLVIVKCEGK